MAQYTSDRTGAELDLTLDNADTHIADVSSNPHAVTGDQVSPAASEFRVNNLVIDVDDLTADSDGVTYDVDMSVEGMRTLDIDESIISFVLSNAILAGASRTVSIRMIANESGFDPLFNFPAGWVWLGPDGAPLSLVATKYAVLSITTWPDGIVTAAYSPEA